MRKRTDSKGSSKSAAQSRSANPWRPEQKRSRETVGSTHSPELAKYLQDHFAGARVGLELARRLASRNAGGELQALAEEIELDRTLLRQLMAILEVKFGRVKQASAWLGGKFVRLRPIAVGGNGSTLGRLLELETLSLGVEGKALLWQALIELKDLVPQLGPIELEQALVRARAQRELLETLRLQAARALART